jgi:hypothetical protein
LNLTAVAPLKPVPLTATAVPTGATSGPLSVTTPRGSASSTAAFTVGSGGGGGGGGGGRCVGLLDRRGVPSNPAYAAVLSGFVGNLNWSSLQLIPTALVSGAIDALITICKQHNASSPKYPWSVFLRISGGEFAPVFAKSIGGAPLSNGTATIGRWWTPAYTAAVTQLHQLLAARYDGTPEISGVGLGQQSMTRYLEPLLKDDWDTGAGQTAVLGAGYSWTADLAEIKAHMAAGAGLWKKTQLHFSFNPAHVIGAATDNAATLALIDYARSLGIVIENNSLRANGAVWTAAGPTLDPHGPLYLVMYQHGRPFKHIQTSTLGKMTGSAASLQATLAYATVGIGAACVELPGDGAGYAVLTPAQLDAFNAALYANA